MTVTTEHLPQEQTLEQEADDLQLYGNELFGGHTELIEEYERAKNADPSPVELPSYLEETNIRLNDIEPAKLTLRGAWQAVRARFSRNRGGGAQTEQAGEDDLSLTLIDYDAAPTMDLSRPSLHEQLAMHAEPHRYNATQAEQILALPAIKPKAERGSKEMSPAAEKFWSGEGYVKRPPKFADQLAQIRENPNVRGNMLMSKPEEIAGNGLDQSGNRTKFTYSEREALLDLGDFLAKTKTVAEADTEDGISQKSILHDVERMEEELTFLGKEEYDEAVAGLAGMWGEYLAQGPDYAINIYNELSKEGFEKSYNVIINDIHKAMLGDERLAPLASQVYADPEQWQTGEHAKLVVVDDWSMGGNTINDLYRTVSQQARKHGKADLLDNLELHMLVAKAGQAEHIVEDKKRYDYKAVRAYYETGDGKYSEREPLSGSHSSVDIAFEDTLSGMSRYLERQGSQREKPLLVDLQRAYKSDKTRSNTAMVAELEEIAHLNGEIPRLRAEMYDDDISDEASDEIFKRLNAAARRQAELISAYNKHRFVA